MPFRLDHTITLRTIYRKEYLPINVVESDFMDKMDPLQEGKKDHSYSTRSHANHIQMTLLFSIRNNVKPNIITGRSCRSNHSVELRMAPCDVSAKIVLCVPTKSLVPTNDNFIFSTSWTGSPAEKT